MKKYIKASLSESTPDWLLKKLNTRYSTLKNKMLQKCNIALDKATYTDEKTSSECMPIYLLGVDYGTTVYIPGVNDDDSESINGRYRKLGSIAKSKLPEMAIDVVYIDLGDPNNIAPTKERYQDPRYTYRYSPDGKYAGQYKKTRYDRETHEEYPDGWSEKGMTPANESRARDKSGYKIPSPEERLANYYSKFPNKITNKVDALYQKLLDTRQLLFEADFNSPARDRWDDTVNIDYSKAYRKFADAVDDYREALRDLKNLNLDDGVYNSYEISRFANTITDIAGRVDDINKILNGERVW